MITGIETQEGYLGYDEEQILDYIEVSMIHALETDPLMRLFFLK